MAQTKPRKEKRLRIKLMSDVKEGKIIINEKLAQELELKGDVEIVVGGKKKLILNAVISIDVPPDQVYINPQDAKMSGIADNTIATIRKASQ